jgi:hypothetical protein
MSACQNCGVALSCGCQKRVASDGKSVCGSCIAKYEKAIATTITVSKPPTGTAPTNVNVFYKAP